MSLILCPQDSQTLYLLSKCKNKLLLKTDLLGPLSGHIEGELRTHVVSLRTVYQPRQDRPRTQESAEGSYLSLGPFKAQEYRWGPVVLYKLPSSLRDRPHPGPPCLPSPLFPPQYPAFPPPIFPLPFSLFLVNHADLQGFLPYLGVESSEQSYNSGILSRGHWGVQGG